MKALEQAIATSGSRSGTDLAQVDGVRADDGNPGEGQADRPVPNYFSTPAAAIRYAAHRPRSQARVLELVAEWLKEELPVERALDVGCGTGHSTVALVPYARRITGVDSSSQMLAQAPAHAVIDYRKAYAEALPFRRGNFDLVTVSSAYHWFDHERFLHEAARVLRPGGWLVLYKAGSMGRIVGQPLFEGWRRDSFRLRYPKVVRNHEPLTAAVAGQVGFSEVVGETTTFRQTYTLDAYIENLMTHSRMIRVVDGGHERIDEARDWLRSELERFFPGGQAEFVHEAQLHVLRRKPGPPVPAGSDARPT